jgi:hypothetical protein
MLLEEYLHAEGGVKSGWNGRGRGREGKENQKQKILRSSANVFLDFWPLSY